MSRAAAQNPFPAAVSQGLAPATPVANAAPAGEKGTQVSTTLAYGGNQLDSTAVPAPPAVPVSTQPPPAPPGPQDLVHFIGGLFHKLFHHKASATTNQGQPSR